LISLARCAASRRLVKARSLVVSFALDKSLERRVAQLASGREAAMGDRRVKLWPDPILIVASERLRLTGE
jgi:hypothetical protein